MSGNLAVSNRSMNSILRRATINRLIVTGVFLMLIGTVSFIIYHKLTIESD